jgi:RNA polymerase sigma-70 factor, ECF subfamily
MTEHEFEQIFKSSFNTLATIAYSVVKDDDTARDIVQQVFLNLWVKRDSLHIKSNLNSYLHRAVVNTAINYQERNKVVLFEPDSTIPDTEDDHDRVSQEVLEGKVRKYVNELPPKCRIVFSLSRFSNMSNKEIASHLGISLKAVEKHIGKALKQLRITLKPFYKSMLFLVFLIFGGRVF